MKKLLILTFVIFASFSACKKSDQGPTTIYTQDQLNGTWENIVKDKDGCANQLVIKANSLSEKTVCTGSTFTANYDSYNFNGSKITVEFAGFNSTYTINQLTDTKLVVTLKVLNTSEKAEYKRLN